MNDDLSPGVAKKQLKETLDYVKSELQKGMRERLLRSYLEWKEKNAKTR